MYKTISINNSTYQQLHALAAKLKKPKSQVIDDLVREYLERMQEEEKLALKEFNSSVKRLSRKIKLPKGTTIDTSDLDKSFSELVHGSDTQQINENRLSYKLNTTKKERKFPDSK